MLLTQIYWRAQKTCILYYLGTKRSGGGHCGCDQRTKHGQEELRHVRGQGQQPGGPHTQRVAAKRSYPTSLVRGSSRQCQAAMAQEQPRRATQRLRSRVADERSYSASEVRGGGWEEIPRERGQGRWQGGATPQPHARGQGQRPGGPTPCPRSSGCVGTGGSKQAIPC